MTYNVFGGTLNLAQFNINYSATEWSLSCSIVWVISIWPVTTPVDHSSLRIPSVIPLSSCSSCLGPLRHA